MTNQTEDTTRRQYLRALGIVTVGATALENIETTRALVNQAGAADSSTITEGFENSSLEKWTGVESAETTTSTVYAGDRSLVITDQHTEADDGKMGNKIERSFASIDPSELTAALRIDDGTWNSVIASWSGNSDNSLTVRLDNGRWSGGEKGISVNGNRISAVEPGRWYQVELLDIDWEANTVGQIHLDGSQVEQNFEFESLPNEISVSTLFVHDGGTGSKGYFDEITVGAQPPSEKTAESGENETGTWPMFHQNARNSGVLTGSELGDTITANWSFDTDREESQGEDFGSNNGGPKGLAVGNDRVYFGSGKTFYAVEKETGSLAWVQTFDHPGAAVGTPCVGENSIFFASEYRIWNGGSLDTSRGWITAFDKQGNQRWQTPVGGTVRSSITKSGDRLYIGIKPGTTNGRLEVMNASTGERVWNKQIGYGVFSTPAVMDEKVFVIDSAPENALRALNASDGSELWRFSGNHAGERLQERCDGPCFTRSSPTVVDGTVYYGTHARYVYAVNADTGNEEWRFETNGRVNGSVAVLNDTVYTTASPPSENDTAKLFAIREGEAVWERDLNSSWGTSPIVCGETVLVGTDSGVLVAYQLDEGEERWRFELDGTEKRIRQPAPGKGAVYLSSADGAVTYLRGDSTGKGEKSNVETQQGQNEQLSAQNPSKDAPGGIPVLNRFTDSSESLGLGAGLLGLLGGSGYVAYRRFGDDSDETEEEIQYD